MNIIARIHNDFPSKFGIPRQSGLVDSLCATIVFEPPYRNPDALRGLEDYSHIWLIWQFSQNQREGWSPTVRPPRLGGNTRMGVFATRSPFRPNPLGLSAVKVERIELHTPLGPVIHISGADLMNDTPIYDIKPYLPFVDSHPEATGGFADQARDHALSVNIPPNWLSVVPQAHQAALIGILSHDPRPSYQHDPQRIYGLPFAGMEIKFTVSDDQLTVIQITHHKEEASTMTDLALAIDTLTHDPALTCVVTKNAASLTAYDRGIRPVLDWLQSDPDFLSGAAAADKVVGKAAALLFIHARIASLHAQVISRPALDILSTHQLPTTYDHLVERISNRAGDGLCPMESRVLEITDAAEAYAVLKDYKPF